MVKLKIILFILGLLLTIEMSSIDKGSMLSQKQWTEELPHNIDESGKLGITTNLSHPFLLLSGYLTSVSVFSETKDLAYIHQSGKIPFNYSFEVVTPPTDAVCQIDFPFPHISFPIDQIIYFSA